MMTILLACVRREREGYGDCMAGVLRGASDAAIVYRVADDERAETARGREGHVMGRTERTERAFSNSPSM